MGRDRLAELRRGNNADGAGEASSSGDIESGFVREGNAALKQFFTQVNEVRGLFGIIRDNVAKLDASVAAALAIASDKELNRKLNEIDALIAEINRYMLTARQRLKDMESDNASFETQEMAKPAKGRNDTDIRTRKTQFDTLTKTFVDVMAEVQKSQNEYRTSVRGRVERQIKIAKPDATPEEIEAAMDQKKPIFAEQILSSSAQAQRTEAIQLLESIRERHERIVKLEKSIEELRQMFIDMQMLVQQQGEMLNDIENAMEQAVNYVEKGLGEMKQSVKLQKKARKKMCIIMCCVIILIAVVLGPVLATQLHSGS